jgi:hypothetical protein
MALGAGNPSMRARQRKLSGRVIEAADVAPLLNVVASFATGPAVGPGSHSFAELALVRILVTFGTGQRWKAEPYRT